MLVGYGLFTPSTASSSPLAQSEVEHGEYIANIARCISCHTPAQEQYQGDELTEEQTRTLALFSRDTLNTDLWMAGGTVFSFGPSGSVTAPNITPDEETGIGRYTDAELKDILVTGVLPNGRRMHGIMPTLNTMADSDIEALIAYMRSVEPIENAVENTLEVTTPPAVAPEEPIAAPAPTDQSERGAYLVDIMGCSGCHTPTDPETRRPIMAQFLAGRDPFQRSYVTVYAGNITPHDETGIGNWTNEAIAEAIVEGIRVDGRRLSLMPWQDYAVLTEADVDAIVHFLTNDVDAVENSIPQTDLQEPYVVYAASEAANADEEDNSNTNIMLFAAVGVVLVGLAGFVLFRRRQTVP
jgi:LPXTG-motif cell wall-anchored protein